jgi:protein-L-isoaspartate(D-aspartate) O-methyltransferase
MSQPDGRLAPFRNFFADLVTAGANVTDPRVQAAFATTPREQFLGPGPWRVFTPRGYIQTPSDDPVFIYQDITVSLDETKSINNGQPLLHALSIGALAVQEGESLLHIGAGTGYYTAILAKLTGPDGSVQAYEIEPRLAGLAVHNLAQFAQVTVHTCSGSDSSLPACDVIYVSAGATGPLNTWLDALRPGGRLLFPMTPAQGHGGMLLLTRTPANEYHARFLCRAAFIPCAGARDEELAKRLATVFARQDFSAVRSLRRNTTPDESCWLKGPDWWLSTAPISSV